MAGKIKFVKRGQSLAATITEDDLAAHDWGSDSPDPINKVRAQDLELPHEINVLYFNTGADYQQGTQKSERMTGAGVNALTIALPVAMNDTKAKQVADVNLFNAWVQRTTYTLQLSRKWSKIEPTDIIDVIYNDVSIRMRVTKKDDAKPGIITLECVAEDTNIYIQSGTGAGSSNIPEQTIKIPVQTIGFMLDIPILRDEDNDAGVYFAAAGYSDGWTGCSIYKSSDGGATYTNTITVFTESTIGYTNEVLGNYYGGNTFDELNSIEVKLLSGELSSISELLVLNGGNYALLGDEIIQFKNAELIDVKTYKLSGLLRGRFGTERNMGSHIAGERFIFISNSTFRRIPFQNGDINLERKFKYVSFGTTLQQTIAKSFTPTGAGLECYSPVLPGAGRNSSNDVIIEWTRRSRISAEWMDYVDAALGEATESYEVDILDSTFTTVKRTLTSSSETVSYTLAQQVADYATEGIGTVYANIYQLSAIVGRGYPLQATFSLPAVLSSTRWRVYITGYTSFFQSSFISEIEMNDVVGGTDQCTGGTASASSGTAANAFDDNTGTSIEISETSANWVEYEFATAVTVGELSITCPDAARAITAFSLQVYISSIWVNVYSATGQTWTNGERKNYTI